MTQTICPTLAEAKSEPLRRQGLALTDFRETHATLFERIENPDAYIARLRHAGQAYNSWRGGIPLDPEFQASTLGWPVTVDLDRGYLLDETRGFPGWEVERAVEGLIAGEPHYIEMASGLLVGAQGCIMEMPGGITAVLVRRDAFKSHVVVREPVLLLGAMNT